MTPLMIEMLFHYNSRVVDFPGLEHPAQQEAIAYFLNNGYLQRAEKTCLFAKYEPTEKLKFYCEALCSVPEPVQKWEIPCDPVHN